ncbi:MAG TPA: glucose-6-phosphate dehydrogenase [Polyangiaceae bacterium]
MASTFESDALVFFGATGDLAHKMVFPALQRLARHGRLDIPVIGVAKAGWTLEQLVARARDSVEQHGGLDEAAFARLSSRLAYIDGDYADPDTFARLRKALGVASHPLHYLAIPPTLFPLVVKELDRSGCAKGSRVVVEKPFGRDRASARKLNETLLGVFPEKAVFRIDHFLGKEADQGILYFRFANSLLEPLWHHEGVASVRITMAESFGVMGRGPLYEETGAIRDVVQNHLLQVVATLAMEPPAGHDVESLRDARSALIERIAPIRPDEVVRGQFVGYHEEPGVAPKSRVETFAALRLRIDTPRWKGVPFVIRAGKCLPVTCTEALVELNPPASTPFTSDTEAGAIGNYARFRVDPTYQIALGVRTKVPGESMIGHHVEMLASEREAETMSPYERLLGDALAGDATLFAREDAVEAEWRVVDGILGDVTPIHTYQPGTWGPRQADALYAHAGGWRPPVMT